MRTLVATALLAYAAADETSLMQDLVKRTASGKLAASADTNRQASTSKLMDMAVKMIKNGVTPDVITFVDATNADINEEVLVAIQSEHDIDQAYINSLCQDFLNAVQALEDHAASIEVHDNNRLAASEAHHACRAEEAMTCAKSRRCEEQLRQKWITVKHEESVMREIHGHIHDEWCIHPPFFAPIEDWLSHPFNWAQTSPYPLLDLPQDVRDFRHVSVGHFHDYMEQKIIVERAWLEYNEKLEECAVLEDDWETKIPVCDQAQLTLREHACEHANANRQARETFGQEWNRIVTLFEQARIAKTANEQDRKAEWETLKIVQCLLDHVHSSVITSIETGGPCPTIDSDPDGVTLAIEDCHIVTRGCDEGSMTAHLCLDWCEPPPIPPLPPVEAPACTPAYVAQEQAQFLAAIQAQYTSDLGANSDYPNDPLTSYNTGLSEAGWAGCAPPLVCVDCSGSEIQAPCLEHAGGSHTCHVHEEYLSPGQSNADTFRCLDGSCILQAGRCNGLSNCADGSDETGCDEETDFFVPAYLSQESECPADFHADVHFRCASGSCIEKVGMCNGHANCADGSDEASCSGAVQVSVEATSGRTITVESLQTHTGVFHDRDYNFDSLGSFQGKTFIKYSNDDKMTDGLHVMTKLRTLEPLTVFIVKLDSHSLAWLEREGFTHSAHTGVSFSGVRETRHKEWDPSLLTTDHFAATSVYSKTFPAGTISVPGNNGGDGSFLMFLDRPSGDDEPIEEPVDQAPTGWRTVRENWNCRGTASSGHDLSLTGHTTHATCAAACYEVGHEIAAFWPNQNQCRCYDECEGGGPTVMPAWPNLVMEKTYHLASTDKKCPHQHGDRLFRSPADGSSDITLSQCYVECQNTPTCAHFSFGVHGGGNVCMGCTTLANEQDHVGFNTYDMERSEPPLQMIENWDFEGMTTNGVIDTLAEGKWIHFTNSGNSGLTNPVIAGWEKAGASGGANGIYNPPNNEVAEGTHVLFLNQGNDNNYVFQNLMQPFNDDIHIEAAVGGGNGLTDGGYRMGLYTQDGTLVKEVAAGVDGAPNTAANGQYILTHLDVILSDHTEYLGQTLQLRLMKNKSGQGHYHYIRFTPPSHD